MRPYEVMIIFDPTVDEAVIRATTDRCTELVRSQGGEPVGVEVWGRRRLAYELAHRSEGFYTLLSVRAEPPAMAELDRMLHLADEVLRHKIIRLPREAVRGRPRSGSPAGIAANRAVSEQRVNANGA